MNYKLELGDNLATLKSYPDNTFDSIVTDPPYGIDFLGKEWDTHTGTVELYKECLRVLKPGGYLLAFSAARTYHKLAYSVELAGFEIRDQLMWLYSSGFPKAQDIGKAITKRGSNGVEWEGYKTALKPAHEPIVMARKPYKGSTIDQVLKNGLGAMNIDVTRVPWADEAEAAADAKWREKWMDSNVGAPTFAEDDINVQRKKKKSDREGLFRKCGNNAATFKNFSAENLDKEKGEEGGWEPGSQGRYPSNVIGEVAEGYQKYFYCPKVSRKERHSGFEDASDTQESMVAAMGGHFIDENGPTTKACSNRIWLPHTGEIYSHGIKHEYLEWQKTNNVVTTTAGNNHPTVKPVALMEYLIKLVTPPSTPTLQRKVLDPFMGSGSTGMAAVKLGHHFTGCELDPKYVAIAATRIDAWNIIDDSGLDPELFE